MKIVSGFEVSGFDFQSPKPKAQSPKTNSELGTRNSELQRVYPARSAGCQCTPESGAGHCVRGVLSDIDQ